MDALQWLRVLFKTSIQYHGSDVFERAGSYWSASICGMTVNPSLSECDGNIPDRIKLPDRIRISVF